MNPSTDIPEVRNSSPGRSRSSATSTTYSSQGSSAIMNSSTCIQDSHPRSASRTKSKSPNRKGLRKLSPLRSQPRKRSAEPTLNVVVEQFNESNSSEIMWVECSTSPQDDPSKSGLKNSPKEEPTTCVSQYGKPQSCTLRAPELDLPYDQSRNDKSSDIIELREYLESSMTLDSSEYRALRYQRSCSSTESMQGNSCLIDTEDCDGSLSRCSLPKGLNEQPIDGASVAGTLDSSSRSSKGRGWTNRSVTSGRESYSYTSMPSLSSILETDTVFSEWESSSHRMLVSWNEDDATLQSGTTGRGDYDRTSGIPNVLKFSEKPMRDSILYPVDSPSGDIQENLLAGVNVDSLNPAIQCHSEQQQEAKKQIRWDCDRTGVLKCAGSNDSSPTSVRRDRYCSSIAFPQPEPIESCLLDYRRDSLPVVAQRRLSNQSSCCEGAMAAHFLEDPDPAPPSLPTRHSSSRSLFSSTTGASSGDKATPSRCTPSSVASSSMSSISPFASIESFPL